MHGPFDFSKEKSLLFALLLSTLLLCIIGIFITYYVIKAQPKGQGRKHLLLPLALILVVALMYFLVLRPFQGTALLFLLLLPALVLIVFQVARVIYFYQKRTK